MFISLNDGLVLVGFVCWLIVLIHAFGNSVWKGLIALFCAIYWVFYAIVEFEHRYKWAIVLLAILCGGLGATPRLIR